MFASTTVMVNVPLISLNEQSTLTVSPVVKLWLLLVLIVTTLELTEKDEIVKRIGNLTKEEKTVDTILKINKFISSNSILFKNCYFQFIYY